MVKIKIQDVHSFPLEVTPEEANTLDELNCRIRELERLWKSFEASKGRSWWSSLLESQADKLSQRNFKCVLNTSRERKKLIRLGIPPALRSHVWLTTSGANRKREAFPTSYYRYLHHDAAKDNVTDAILQIDLDLHRTFPDHSWLSSHEGCQSLRRVLVAYSFRNSRVGYCQGINYIAGYLLLAMKSEEDAFWMLVVLIEDILHSDLYSNDLNGCQIENAVFKELVRHKIPRLAEHLEEIQFDPELVTTRWFMCLFVINLPSETTMRIWDVLFNEGPNILFMVALVIFELSEDRLLATTEPEEALEILISTSRRIYDPELLLHMAYKEMDSVTPCTIASIRQKYGDPRILSKQTTSARTAGEEQKGFWEKDSLEISRNQFRDGCLSCFGWQEKCKQL